MRWGKEELAWHDVFNSVKLNTRNHQKHISEEKKSLWKDFNWDISSIWEDKYRETSHTFACFFGDIKAIYPQSGQKFELELKNGTILDLEGGSNDVGSYIQIYDYELGLIKIQWNRIKSIQFEQASWLSHLPFGELLYGNVKTYRKGNIEGYIKWDLDERTTTDILDGYNEDGEQAIPFENIKRIIKDDKGSWVTLKSGRETFLKGSNDVNYENRGIAVYNEDIGRIELSWREFKELELYPNKKRGPVYSDFKTPEGIYAEIVTYGNNAHSGMIVYDIDEKWELELIDGDDDNVKYQVPFRNVKTIYPKNKSYSILTLKSGQQLLLGERQDVSYDNDGILLFVKSQEDPMHIKWTDVIEIRIR